VGVDASQITVECQEVPSGGTPPAGNQRPAVDIRTTITGLTPTELLDATSTLTTPSTDGTSEGNEATLNPEWKELVVSNLNNTTLNTTTVSSYTPRDLTDVTIAIPGNTTSGGLNFTLVTNSEPTAPTGKFRTR
jgi:hypothetical protein